MATDTAFENILKNYQNHLGFNKNETLDESRERKTNTLLNDAFRFAITDTTCFPIQKIGEKIITIASSF